MSAAYRVRLRAEIAAIAHSDDTTHERVGRTLTGLLRADLPPAQIVPAITAAISSESSTHAQRLLDRARLAVIGNHHITTATTEGSTPT